MDEKKTFKRRVFDIIQIGYKGDLPSCIFDIFISVVIILNILAMTLETFESLSPAAPVFEAIELFTVAVFCVEYILRLWTADLLYPQYGKITSRLRFLISYDGIIDLLTILPFYFLSGFIVFRMLRVVRIFRLFKINTQYDSFNVITAVLKERRKQIISSVFIILILMLASSIGMYSAEHNAQCILGNVVEHLHADDSRVRRHLPCNGDGKADGDIHGYPGSGSSGYPHRYHQRGIC